MTTITMPIKVFNKVVIAIKLLGTMLEDYIPDNENWNSEILKTSVESFGASFPQQLLDDLEIEDSVFDLDCDF